MKSIPYSIKLPFFFAFFCFLSSGHSALGQGYNDNEWIFGECASGDNTYLSFGKGTSPTVQTLDGPILDPFSNTVAIDPITGQPVFFSNGTLAYNYNGDVLQGLGGNLNGPIDTRQQAATGFLDYDPDGDRLFYLFYVSPAGQLLYAIVDMNAPGQSQGNEPPLGEVIERDQLIGNAQGPILVVKTPASPSYLINFDGGNLVSRRLEDTAGQFTETDTQALPFTPKAIVFDPDQSQLLLIPQDAGEAIRVVDFDTSTGSFGAIREISSSSGSDPIEGAVFSEDDAFIYFSRGNELFRVPADDLDAVAESIPLDPQPSQVFDLKVGPDGQLYFLYEENPGGPQLMGRVENPNEPDLAAIEVEIDPFAGADFCGTIFPTFAPNADISPQVDFTWSPEMPCSNNPIQLTSEILPENYRPVSFNWEFDPPLTDSLGNELPSDYSQEHFLIPAAAAQGESISVSLTVTFADGQTVTVPQKTITLTENTLQANFTPQDTTICEGQCVDIGPLLQAQAGDSQGGGGGGGGGGGSQQNFEYFWSNYRDEGWTTRQENEVCLPGTYWVMVREPGSSCYVYAEMVVNVWDLQNQNNGIWYFGDGAGLNFNPDPEDESAPTPRPIEESHGQNIPAGTTTITDVNGEVLFFTDGQSVWDLNGDLMENGDNIGGDNSATQAVTAIGVPQEPTLYYLFTTQRAEDGSNQVKFSLVDIAGENQTGVGNVATKDNFLFSPSTEHAASFANGDTTWVLFHELGNDTFRAYPISNQGIGEPVFSSVGSNHGFGSGVGTMKFSPDGEQVAVTISEDGCNRLELFDFDAETGEMTEYALLDLGCDGEVYGLEFSDSGDKVFVSYRNGGPGVEEFTIRSVEDATGGGTCPACFGNASSQTLVESCILSTRGTVTGTAGLELGALQIGPDGNIYLAVVGSNQIGQILVGAGCETASTFTQDAVEAMPGPSNLGLPSFSQTGGSSISEPGLSGPNRLCISQEDGEIPLFEGGGEPDIDSYFWTITREDGTVIRTDGGPGDQFQTLEQEFTEPGRYTVALNVTRCATADYFDDSLEVLVDGPAPLTLPDEVTLCSGDPVTLTAIDGYDSAEGLYDFLWTDAGGQVYGDENTNSLEVTEEGEYTVTVSLRIPDGLSEEEEAAFQTCPAETSVFVGPSFEFEINQDVQEVCYEEVTVNFIPDTPISGEWYYEQDGDGNRVLIGEFFELALDINTLPGPGSYEITLRAADPLDPDCFVEQVVTLIVSDLPFFLAEETNPAADCTTLDGAFEVTMQENASSLTIQETGESFSNLTAGDIFSVSSLSAGIYTLEAINTAGCSYITTVAIRNQNPPAEFSFSVTALSESCGATEIENGGLTISFDNGAPSTGGAYLITRQGDGDVFDGTFGTVPSFTVAVPAGEYSVEITTADECSIPDPDTYTVDEREQVLFSVPGNPVACEEFTFRPQSSQSLTFTLTDAGGTILSPDGNGDFTVTTSGEYLVRGEDPTGTDCPLELPMSVEIIPPLQYQVSEPSIDCQSGVTYVALVDNADPASVTFSWRDAQGIEVGRQQQFVPPRAGDYSLLVERTGETQCPAEPVPFTAIELEEEIDISLETNAFCDGTGIVSVSIEGDLTTVSEIIWFLNSGGTSTRLPTFDNLESFETNQAGIYEVNLIGPSGCEIARDTVEIFTSTSLPPVVNDLYTICAPEGNSVAIDPGSYTGYSWSLDGTVVSTDSIFTPEDPGTYLLEVSDEQGCAFSDSFEVREDCFLDVNFPTGIVIGNSDKDFRVFPSEYVDEVEVFIFNRWGELIFHCATDTNETTESICPWDGTVDGNTVINGTYVVVVKFTSRNQNRTEEKTKAITVIH